LTVSGTGATAAAAEAADPMGTSMMLHSPSASSAFANGKSSSNKSQQPPTQVRRTNLYTINLAMALLVGVPRRATTTALKRGGVPLRRHPITTDRSSSNIIKIISHCRL